MMPTPSGGSGPTPTLRVLSFTSRLIPASFFAIVCVAFWMDFEKTGRFTSLAWIASEGLVVILFVVRRYSDQISRRPFDWVLAIGGVMVFIAVRPVEHALVPQAVGLALQMVGLIIQVAGKAVLGRSFGIVPANRGIVTAGPYRLVRHPIYLGYLVSHVGFLLTNLSVRNAIIYAGGYILQIARIVVEERVLRRDPAYEAYCGRIKYRLLPGIF
jgi:protein-S-isoprenylcysteine O-methyltransferase Ste14